MTRKDDKRDQPSGGETTWTKTGATRYGRGQHKTGSVGDDMLRPSPNHGTLRLPNDDESLSLRNARTFCIARQMSPELVNTPTAPAPRAVIMAPVKVAMSRIARGWNVSA